MPDPSREENFFTATSLALLATTSASGAGVHSMFLKNEQFSLISKPKWGGALNIHVVENEKDIKELADNKIYIRAQENFLKEDKKKKDEPEPMPEPLSSNNRLFVPQRFVSLTEINPAKGSLSVGRGQRSWMKKEENQGKDHWQANRNRKARQNDHEAGEHGIS